MNDRQSLNKQAVIWSAIVLALGTFGQQVAAGAVPIPPEWAWVVPVVLAFINALAPNVRR